MTVQGKTYQLPEPFFVFATQNPIEQEGTYPLPEAQLDRFMFEIVIDYLDRGRGDRGRAAHDGAIQRRSFEHAVTGRRHRRLPGAGAPGAGGRRRSSRYAVDLVRASRPDGAERARLRQEVGVATAPACARPQYLILGGKARALLHGRYHVSFEDIRALAQPVLRHRILTNFHAESERVTHRRQSSSELLHGGAACRGRGSE